MFTSEDYRELNNTDDLEDNLMYQNNSFDTSQLDYSNGSLQWADDD